MTIRSHFSMLDIHIALCSIIWGIVVLIPPNNFFGSYITLRALGSWGIGEFWAGVCSILGGVIFLIVALKPGYKCRRTVLILGSGWWALVSLSVFQAIVIHPSVAFYLITSIMCSVQAIRAKHQYG